MLVIAMSAVFATPNWMFAWISAAVILGIGGWEGARLGGILDPKRYASGAFLVLVSIGFWHWLSMDAMIGWLWVVAATWLIPLVWLQNPTRAHRPWMVLSLLAVFLSGAWLSLVLLQAQSPWLIVLVLLVIAGADIGAYFTGKGIGGPKLAPKISPGKTRSGAIGGLIAAAIIGPIGLLLLPIEPFVSPWLMALLALALAPISIVGDLFISVLKRHAGLKDSSNLLPGHGGILDRLDSLGAALPFFTLALWWAQRS